MKTKIIKVNINNRSSFNKLKSAAELIRNGKLVVFPTETVYGLGADATDTNAVRNIYKAKGRPSDNPLIVHIANPQDAKKYAYTNSLYYKLADKFMPGPLTVIMKSKSSIPKTTRGGLDTVAIRCPQNAVARKLIEYSKRPIAAPSANLSGSPSPTSFKHVCDDMNGRVNMIINSSDSDFGLESTIVKIEDENTLTLLRPGKITVDDLRGVCEKVNVAHAVTEELKEGDRALSPGMKYRHYAPKAPLILLDGSIEKISEYLSGEDDSHTAVILYDEDIDILKERLMNVDFYNFGASNDRLTQAHRLFYILREVDKKGYKKIFAPLPSQEGIGLALYNRMIRASAHNIIKL